MVQLPQVNRQAPDDQGADTAAADASSRKRVSKRGFILADGTEADNIESAAGASYTLLSPTGNKEFKELFSNEKFKTMCAIFGFHTKVGNVANTVLNDKDEPGSPDDAAAAIEEFILKASDAADPQWAERSAGGVGARIDKDALAGAIVEVGAAAGKTFDYAKVRDKLETDPQYVRSARQVPAVATAYATRVGKATKSIDDLMVA